MMRFGKGRRLWASAPFLCLALMLAGPFAFAADPYEAVRGKYPGDGWLLGVGTVKKSGNDLKDRRVSEVMARAEIARQIKVHIRETTVDIACAGSGSPLFGKDNECRSSFSMVLEERVEEFLEGSRIVEQGEKGEYLYAVAVIEKKKVAGSLGEKSREAADRAKVEIDKAKAGDPEAKKEALEELKRAVALEQEKAAIEGVKERSASAYEDLEKELKAVK